MFFEVYVRNGGEQQRLYDESDGRMKILQVHNFYRVPGGECSVVRAEEKLLIKHGHKVVQFFCDSGSIDDFSFLRKIRLFLGITYNQRIFKDAVIAIRAQRPDVAHVHNVFPMMSPSVYAALKHCGVPVVQTLHNFRFLCPNGQFFVDDAICEDCITRGLHSAVLKRCVRGSFATSAMYALAISRAWKSGILPNAIDKYIALNKFVAQKMILGGIPKQKIAICGNYIEPTVSSVAAKQPYILYLGRLSAEKGISTLFKALSLLEGVVLKVAGSGPEEERLKNEASEFDGVQVQFLGHISGRDKQKIIAEALCTVVPSEWYENFPISVLESMSLGTPVVASRIGGLPDMIEHGINGMLFEAGNYGDLASCIRAITEDLTETQAMAEKAMHTAIEKFGPEEHYRQLMAIYQDAVSENKVTVLAEK